MKLKDFFAFKDWLSYRHAEVEREQAEVPAGNRAEVD